MSDTPNLDFLRQEVAKLKDLLDHPEPGLSTWNEACSKRMEAIIDFWAGKDNNGE